uniref:Uncharacterized protein n=1 Tax=Arundo donax TaxID=35708 RepID=A0A0A9GQS9_ARUDO
MIKVQQHQELPTNSIRIIGTCDLRAPFVYYQLSYALRNFLAASRFSSL